MRLDSMPIPPKREETEDLRKVLEAGPAGEKAPRSMSLEFETDLSARLRELDMSYMNISRLLQAIDEIDLEISAWQEPATGEGVDLTARDEIAISVRAEWADFAMEAPSGTSVSPETNGAHRLPLPTSADVRLKTVKKEPKPLGLCTDCFNILNPDGTFPMECGT
jgi:hypothetical protein